MLAPSLPVLFKYGCNESAEFEQIPGEESPCESPEYLFLSEPNLLSNQG